MKKKLNFKFSVLILPLFFVFVKSASAAVVYVDNLKSCPGNGSSITPYCSIQNAFNVVSAGDDVRIRTGTGIYDQSVTLTRSGMAGNPIVIESDTGTNFIIRFTGNDSQSGAFNILGSSYVTVQNLVFDGNGAQTSRAALYIEPNGIKNGDGFTIQNNTFKNWGGNASNVNTGKNERAPIWFNYGFCDDATPCPFRVNNPVIQGNIFQNNRQSDIVLMSVFNAVVQNNDMSGLKCGRNGDGQRHASSIFIHVGRTHGSDGNVFKNNTIHDFENSNNCGVTSGGVYDFWGGLWCDVGPSSNTMEGNHIYNINQGIVGVGATGAHIEARCFDWTLKNNVIHDIGDDGLSQRNYGDTNPANWNQPPTKYYNNTIYNTGNSGLNLGAGLVNARNNIIYGNGNGTVLVRLSQDSASRQIFDYNVYFDPTTSSSVAQNDKDNGGTIRSLSSWQSTYGLDLHSLFTNPLFTNLAGRIFQLQSGSPAIDKGTSLSGVTTDFLGVARPVGSAYDIGAYEYVSTTLLGDLNGDRIVNSLDWSLMSAKWLTNDTNADLNKDGAVNSLDWSIMSSNWLKTG